MHRPGLTVISQASGSGMGRFTVELVQGLKEAGASVTLIAPLQPRPLHCAKYVAVRSFDGVRTRRRRFLLYILQPLGVALAVLRCAKPGVPVLMVHLAAMLPFSLLPILAARLRFTSIALSLHDFYPHTMRFPRRLQRLERLIYRWAYRRFDLILTNNPEQAARLREEANVPSARIAQMFHGTFPVENVRPPVADDDVRLLVFGSLRPNKRVIESIVAIARLRAAGIQVRLRIAGAPRREDAAYWQACSAAIPNGDTGFEIDARFIDETELPQIFSGVDAFLCPYLDFESQSGVSITAASNGIPIIGTRAAKAGMADIDNLAFVVVDPAADAHAIAEAVLDFLTIPRGVRLAAAAALRQRLCVDAGWGRLARLYIESMTRLGFFGAFGISGREG